MTTFMTMAAPPSFNSLRERMAIHSVLNSHDHERQSDHSTSSASGSSKAGTGDRNKTYGSSYLSYETSSGGDRNRRPLSVASMSTTNRSAYDYTTSPTLSTSNITPASSVSGPQSPRSEGGPESDDPGKTPPVRLQLQQRQQQYQRQRDHRHSSSSRNNSSRRLSLSSNSPQPSSAPSAPRLPGFTTINALNTTNLSNPGSNVSIDRAVASRASPSSSSTTSSSTAVNVHRERREFRPTYQQEEVYFIWYHRVDLGLDWPEVRNAYNDQFPERQRRGFQGIQCKYYRCCEGHGVPRVRDRNRQQNADRAYGVRARLPHLWYDWMRPEREGSPVGDLLPAHDRFVGEQREQYPRP